MSFPWRRLTDHINEKELRAAFAEVRRRAKSKRHLGSRYLHLLDSAVALGVLTRQEHEPSAPTGAPEAECSGTEQRASTGVCVRA